MDVERSLMLVNLVSKLNKVDYPFVGLRESRQISQKIYYSVLMLPTGVFIGEEVERF